METVKKETQKKVTKAEKGRTIPIMDIYQASYLALKKHEPSLSKQAGRVVFEFSGTEEMKLLMKNYNQNPTIKILDYVGHLRRLRAMMVGMRK